MAVFQIKPSQKPHKNFYAYYRKDLTRIRYKRRKPPAVTIYRGNFAPKKFTGKEQDQETGLYYYGARYLDPKTSRWLSTDPALGDYLPVAPNNDDAKKHNQNLPGMGGVFNVVNLHVYHYAGNNPVKLVDPDGEDFFSALKSLFGNDGSTKIFTIGLFGNETTLPQSMASGVGIYINPKNDTLFITSIEMLANPTTRSLGLALLVTNIEDAGVLGDISGGFGFGLGMTGVFSTSFSGTLTLGMFNSVEDATGPYTEMGGALSIKGFSFGVDVAFDLKSGDHIGTSISIGTGIGTAVFEFHERVGVTGIISFFKGVIPLNDQ